MGFDRARGVLAIIGGITVNCAFGSVYTFGNMAPYIVSYIRERSKPPSIRNKDIPILFAVTGVFLGACMPIGGILLRKVGPKISVLVGGLILSAGVMLSYPAIDSSFYLLVFTYGVLFGLGISLGYIPPLVCAMKWFPNNKGFVNGIMSASLGFSVIFFDPIQTAYINPNNLAPNVSLPGHPDEKYFDDVDILNRTRMSFIIFGVVYTSLIVIGVLFIAEPQSEYIPVTTMTNDEKTLLINEDDKDDESIMNLKNEHKFAMDTKQIDHNLTPKEMLKTREFWLLWSTFSFFGIVIVFINGLYKAFGQNFIADDTFLAAVGSASAVFNAGGKLFWGAIADLFSCRTAMLGISGSTTFFMLTFMLVPQGGKWMYLVWVCAIIFESSGMFAQIATVTARSFGAEHVGINTSIIMTGMSISGIVGALVPIILQDRIGWNGIFVVVAAMSAIAFVLIMVCKLRRPTGERV